MVHAFETHSCTARMLYLHCTCMNHITSYRFSIFFPIWNERHMLFGLTPVLPPVSPAAAGLSSALGSSRYINTCSAAEERLCDFVCDCPEDCSDEEDCGESGIWSLQGCHTDDDPLTFQLSPNCVWLLLAVGSLKKMKLGCQVSPGHPWDENVGSLLHLSLWYPQAFRTIRSLNESHC